MDLQEFKGIVKTSQTPNFNHVTSIKFVDFSTLSTTIPQHNLKKKTDYRVLSDAFLLFTKGNRRYKCLVLSNNEAYFVNSDSKNSYF